MENLPKTDESPAIVIDKYQNEIIEIIGVKNNECLKFFGAFFAPNDTNDKNKEENEETGAKK